MTDETNEHTRAKQRREPWRFMRVAEMWVGGKRIDLTERKIYFDKINKQYRHWFDCARCGAALGCMCFNSLKVAYNQVVDGIVCTSCWFDECASEFDTDELIEQLDESQINETLTLALAKLHEIAVAEGESISITIGELLTLPNLLCIASDFTNDIDDVVRDHITGILTDGQKATICAECGDYANGEQCEM